MKKRLILMLVGALTTLAHAQTPSSYLCVSDKATGFAFDKRAKQWNQANFYVENKYLIYRSTSKGHAWEVKKVGPLTSINICVDDFNFLGHLSCKGGEREFRFSNASLRFTSTHLVGYWSDANPKVKSFGEEGDEAPYIEIGKCSPL